jgi:hypothetical protein
LAGCGGGDAPTLARSDAAPLIALSKRIPGEDRCAQARDIRALHTRAVALVNARRVPAKLQETLISGVNQLAAQAPVCVPHVSPVAIEPTAPTVTVPDPVPRRGHGHGHKPKHHGKSHGEGKGH